MFEALISGYFTALSLILAIGAQNAFVLRQGLRQEYVGLVVAICAISDALLITLGVVGFGAMSRAAPWALPVMKWGGVAFLVVYGALRFRAAMQGGEALVPSAAARVSRGKVVTTILLLTWANPHVYLDTVLLLGSVSAQHDGHRLAFGIAAAAGSFSFFSALGFGARFLAPVFAEPRAWVVLEIGVGLVMWAIALSLAFS
ncbi:LysE/ArgO family amino acid transporter [Pseudomonas sp. GX19020]|uniref:LysE/ArgO family amino acid transporter n=1 Tax=Pseudomonas sp. GX19020 TaxID=2942277 RepID=UPI002018E2B2|nr:LysE/ArgO family amino acid transporter [Pseudomonas sp. GX19020]MCL4067771.1 LysE/ArgO family amino acid transporter [Pseudomonas sp. GX19020]